MDATSCTPVPPTGWPKPRYSVQAPQVLPPTPHPSGFTCASSRLKGMRHACALRSASRTIHCSCCCCCCDTTNPLMCIRAHLCLQQAEWDAPQQYLSKALQAATAALLKVTAARVSGCGGVLRAGGGGGRHQDTGTSGDDGGRQGWERGVLKTSPSREDQDQELAG
jgi:hypothetical protein